jgi:tRNA A-37 threonylcarbamoyl transferase component Bud32
LLGFGGYKYESWSRLGPDIAECSEEEFDHLIAQELTAEVQKVLAMVHKADILHRDVALRNILVRKACS